MLKNSKAVIHEINCILTDAQKKSMRRLFGLMLVSAATEAFGISLIVPYFAVLSGPDAITENRVGRFFAHCFRLTETGRMLIWLTVLLIVAFGIKYLLSGVIRVRQAVFVNENRFALAKRVMRSYIRADYESYLYQSVPQIVDTTVTQITWAFELLRAVLKMAVRLSETAALTVLMLAVDIRITVFFLAGVGVLLLLFQRIFSPKLKAAGEEANSTWEEYEKTICEAFMLKKENDVFQRNDRVFAGFCEFGKRNIDADTRKVRYSVVPGLATSLIGVWGILFFVLYFVVTGRDIAAQLGTLSVFYLALIRIVPGVTEMYSCLQQISFYRPSLGRVYGILHTAVISDSDQSLNRHPRTMCSDITLTDVTFRYRNTEQPVFTRLNLDIPCGERVGIVGKTGSGKTTLINLILGMLRPENGSICIDGVPFSEEDILDAGYVPQETNLLEATVEENILFGREIPPAQLQNAVAAAGLNEWLQTLPQGIKTQVGAQGMRLSGGQRQRIGIARALAGEPSVLVFDEATAALDTATEQEIIETVKELQRDKTVIMVSHRPGTLKFCDRWYCVSGGRLTRLDTLPQ